jgi:Arylsulfotransferase (ASST)
VSKFAGGSVRHRDAAEGKAKPVRFAGFLRQNWDVVLFCIGLLGIVFAGGVAVAHYHLFPYQTINNGVDAFQDWRENWRHYLQIRSKYLLPTARTAGGVTVHDQASAWPGYTFLTMYRNGRYGASLIDMEGRLLHTWDVAFSDIWPEQEHLEVTPPDFDVHFHGAVLFPNGDVILSLAGVGAVRIDACSGIVWNVPAATHHAVDHLPNGETLMLARHEHHAASPGHPRLRPGPSGYLFEDTVLRVGPDGSVTEEISILDILYDSGWQALLLVGDGDPEGDDPTHLNDVEVLRADMADAFPLFEAGDVALSLRDLNTILVVDGRTWRIKWTMTGPFMDQHDPDFLPNGHILVFDNRGLGFDNRGGIRTRAFHASRILEIDPVTRQIVWTYQGTDSEPFFTEIRGKQQALPSGNVLVVEADGGRVFEIAREPTNRIVWEYVNLAEDGFVGVITDADRVAPERLRFLGRECG